MRAVTGPLLAVALLVTALGVTCGNDKANSGIFAIAFTLRDGEGQEATTFARGAPITFELSVRNRTASEHTITFRSTQRFEFQVFPRGSEAPLWTWSRGLIFAQVLGNTSFEPGAVRTFSANWDQIADNGAAVGAGAFEARGFLVVVGGGGEQPLEDPRVADVHAVEFTVQ